MKIKRIIKYNLYRLLRLKASPHQVAAGFTMGLVPSWFPTFGIGPIISVGLAKLLRVNTVAAIVAGVIGTPIWPLLFLFNYKVGSLILDRKTRIEDLEDVNYTEALQQTIVGINNNYSSGYLFLTGALINVVISSIVIYITVFFLFKTCRTRILRKMK